MEGHRAIAYTALCIFMVCASRYNNLSYKSTIIVNSVRLINITDERQVLSYADGNCFVM